MKKNIKNLCLMVLAIFYTGCNDEFLERYPLDSISSEIFWNTEDDLMAYNNNLYWLASDDKNVPIMLGHTDGAAGIAGRSSVWMQDYSSDNCAAHPDRNSAYVSLRSQTHIVPVSETAQMHGYRGWEFVRAVNIGLANYNRADIPQSIINRYVGEARLFRGWFYADKVSKFGDVHWLDKEVNIDSEELFAPRTPREVVMEKVLADLNFAVEHLPANWGDGNAPGRLNKWAALLVKSRVCLFEGTWRKYHGGSNPEMWLQEAAAAANDLMNNGPYSLYNTGNPEQDYNAYHRVLDLTGNSEVIYWRKYILGILRHRVSAQHNRFNGGVSRNMVEDYLCTDGLPITLSPLYAGDNTIEDVFINRDPRLRQTVLHPEDGFFYDVQNHVSYPYPIISGMGGGGTLVTFTGYQEIKHFVREEYDAGPNGSMPAITLRLGEALLNYAEAKAELGTLSQADLDLSINKLRDRVGMPHMDINNIPVDPRYTNDGVSPLIVEIRRERRVELYGEGFRYDDLRRWKQGKKFEKPTMGLHWDDVAKERYIGANVLTSVDPENGRTYIDVYKGTMHDNVIFDENKHYLWPIPLSVLSENTNITQNPNW